MDAHARDHSFYEEGLTGLRALAALWVVLFHVNAIAGPRILSIELLGFPVILHPLLGGGWVGASVFFVLSGFLLTIHLLDRLERGDPRTVGRYYVARARRVLPAFWGQMAIFFVLALALEGSVPGWTRFVVLHLLMIHNLTEEASYAINNVYWTLPIEFTYYLLLPLIAVRLSARERDPRRWKLLLLLYGAAAATSIAYRYATYPLGGLNIAWISNQIPGTIDQFVIGTVAAAGWRWWRSSHVPGPGVARLSTALAVVGLGGIIAGLYYLNSIYTVFWEGHPALYVWYSINAVFIAMLVLGVAMGGRLTRLVFGNRVAVFLGTISYSVYLWHLPVALWVGAHTQLSYPAFFVAAIAASIAVSAVSYRLLERPFLARYSARTWSALVKV